MTENLPATAAQNLDHRTKHEIRQALIFGATIQELCARFHLPTATVVDFVQNEMGEALSPRARKAIALARIDELAPGLVEQGANGNLDAINTWIKLQKREATLAGLDEPDKQERRVVIEAPWLEARRLSYKDNLEIAEDIAHRPGRGAHSTK